jgi:hypothetical protein
MADGTGEPFWEAAYRDLAVPNIFGSVSEEIRQLVQRLAPEATILDSGCGSLNKDFRLPP